MDPKDFIRGFFGIPRPPNINPRSPEDDEMEEDHSSRPRMGIQVFTNPLEMESFFSEQFDEILKQFGFGQFSGPGFYGSQVHPGMMAPPSEDDNNTDESGARDFMLKKDDHPGYIRSNQLKDRQDLEIDQVTPDDLDKLYSHDVQPQQKFPHFPQGPNFGHHGGSFSFGHSFSSKSVRMPDGSMEEHQTVKDNEGRETVTVTKKTGEECLTIKTIKHPDGREERIESNECPQMKQFSSTLKQ